MSIRASVFLMALLFAAFAYAEEDLRLYVESGIHHSARSVAFAPGERFVATGSLDRTIKIWDYKTSRELMTLPNKSMALFLAFLPAGKILVSSNEDGTVNVWDLSSESLVSSFKCSDSGSSISLADSGATLLCADEKNGAIRRWDTSTFSEMPPILIRNTNRLVGWHLTENGSFVTGRDQSGLTQMVDTDTMRVIGDFRNGKRFSVESISFAQNSERVATADGSTLTIWRWSASRNGAPQEEKRIDLPNIRSLNFSPDEQFLACAMETGDVIVLNTTSWEETTRLESYSNRIENAGVLSNPDMLVVQVWYDTKLVLDLKKGTLTDRTMGVPVDNWETKGRLDGRQFSVSNNRDFLRIETNDGVEICTLVFLDKQHAWVVVSPDGRFDTNMDLNNVRGAHWIVSNRPFDPLPLEIFLRDYYEPRLLPRLLAGGEGALQPVRPLGKLNRLQPKVRIVGVRSGGTRDSALVTVEVSENQDMLQENGKTKTSAYDLRLFRGGQLVGQWPEPKAERGTREQEDIAGWREVSRVPMEEGQTRVQHTFQVPLASRDRGKQVVFTSYAFNEDRVKSETVKNDEFRVPEDIALRKPRAYVIAVGVNIYENPARNLSFAAKDAKDIGTALLRIKDYEVVPLTLVSDKAHDGAAAVSQATKANIRVVLSLLAGKAEVERERLKRVPGIDKRAVDKLAKATPDDLVIISFSGHGYTEQTGQFYLLPSDSGKESKITPAVLPKFISSDDLSQWLREVDAGQIAMIIDACHSAASVDRPGFKPGPMGDRGLGQLAYDKAMRILAASQADDVALESNKLRQGLLTYVLVSDGLAQGSDGNRLADTDHDGVLTLAEWLKYGEQRTPALYEDILANRITPRYVGKDPILDSRFRQTVIRRAQTPTLFDFERRSLDVILSP